MIKPALIQALLFCAALSTGAAAADDFNPPDIGTAGIMGLSLQKEELIGSFFMRAARSNLPIAEDPVLTEYVSAVGNKLVANASHVYFPFEFFVVNNPELNAAAFLGGKVQVNTGLLLYADTEDEFASVLAHEVSHVTQRHLARLIESQARANSMTLGSMIGSVIMGLINPAMGMAALSASIGGSMQSRINFTRDNEMEADRVGIALLNRAGFNPAGMTDMFRKLYSEQGNLNPQVAMLIDHPLSQVRIAEAQNRVNQLPVRANSRDPDFDLAKARVLVRYGQNRSLDDLKAALKQGGRSGSETFKNYALALIAFEQNDQAEARHYLQQLPASLKRNIFVLDLLTDLDLKAGNAAGAAARLLPYYRQKPDDPAIVINLANAYLEGQQYQDCVRVLKKYLRAHPQETLALDLITRAYDRMDDRCNALQSRAESLDAYGNFDRAIGTYNQALNTCGQNLTRERIRARISQIAETRALSDDLTKP